MVADHDAEPGGAAPLCKEVGLVLCVGLTPDGEAERRDGTDDARKPGVAGVMVRRQLDVFESAGGLTRARGNVPGSRERGMAQS